MAAYGSENSASVYNQIVQLKAQIAAMQKAVDRSAASNTSSSLPTEAEIQAEIDSLIRTKKQLKTYRVGEETEIGTRNYAIELAVNRKGYGDQKTAIRNDSQLNAARAEEKVSSLALKGLKDRLADRIKFLAYEHKRIIGAVTAYEAAIKQSRGGQVDFYAEREWNSAGIRDVSGISDAGGVNFKENISQFRDRLRSEAIKDIKNKADSKAEKERVARSKTPGTVEYAKAKADKIEADKKAAAKAKLKKQAPPTKKNPRKKNLPAKITKKPKLLG